MKIKNYFIKIIKKISNKKSISKLIFKSCIIDKISSGIYIYYPIFNKIINNLKIFIKKEMDKIDFIEIYLPLIQPKFLWNISERYFNKNLNLFEFNKYILSPTNEEIINYFLKNKNLNFKDFPLNFYNLNFKLRNEIRPSLNIFKTKEFLMKDGYSFCLNIYDLKKTYELIFIKYINIFNKLNLNFKIILKKDFNMKSIYSHEFYSNYKIYLNFYKKLNFFKNFNLKYFYIPNIDNTYILKKYIKINIINFIKKIIIISNLINNKIFFCFLYLKINFLKNLLLLKKNKLIFNNKFLNKYELIKIFNLKLNYIKFFKNINFKILVDFSIKNFKIFLNFNYKNYQYNLKKNIFKKFNIKKIEIAHIFQLGNFFSKKFNFKIKDIDNKYKYLLMNSYGIGINRLLYSYMNQNYDKKGFIWNNLINPFILVICPLDYNKKLFIKDFTKKLYENLLKYKKNIILDNRNLKIFNTIKDWDLIGIPHKIIISEKNLKKKIIEYVDRKTLKVFYIKILELKNFILNKIL